VFVTANYKMSFDCLRTALDGRDGWVLVLDTNGINVWCAAGKGTFGTEELIARIAATRLPELVSHRKLVLPQLGAPGIAAHEVGKRSGFRVTYGPVRAADLPAFLGAGMKATSQMRRVTFGLTERLVLIPMEVVPGLKYAAAVAGCVFLLAGLGRSGYTLGRTLEYGTVPALLCLLAFLGGAVATPALLPWVPGRAFSLKGAMIGFAIALTYALLRLRPPISGSAVFASLPWLLALPAISSFFAMNFTGASTYTSLSGVKREMRIAVPAQAAAMVAGVGLWLAHRFL
jgi:acetyl-CoA decarbonylase/synthase complex subunit gamma